MKLEQLILNELSRKNLESYLLHPSQALLLTGALGVGLSTVARSIAKQITQNNFVELKPHLHDQQKTANINAEDIREVVKLSQNRRASKFVTIVNDCEKMTNGTAEIFLKTLEEPAHNSYFILTTHNPALLPATIFSRTSSIELLPTDFDLAKLAEQVSVTKITAKKLSQVKFMASSFPAEATRLLADEEYFREKSSRFTLAREFITGDASKRLVITSQITNRTDALDFVSSLAKIIIITVAQNPRSFAKNLTILSDTTDRLAGNANVKIQLNALALNLE